MIKIFQHLGVNFAKILEAFIVHRDDEDGPGAYLNRLNTFQNLAGCSLYLAQTLIADSVLLGRATIVWGLDWRLIAFPFLLYIGSFGMFQAATQLLGNLYLRQLQQ